MLLPPTDPYLSTANTQSTFETMGHTWRTPSPSREAYISSSNVNSPQVVPEAHDDLSDEYSSYQRRVESRASGTAAVETAKHNQRRDAALSRLYNVFDGKSDSGDQKPYSQTVSANSEDGSVGKPEQPSTPKKNRVPLLWHGLPSPETPTFHNYTRAIPSASSAQEELSWQTSLEEAKNDVKTALVTANHTTNTFSVPAQSPIDGDNANDDGLKPIISQTPKDDTGADARLARELEESLNPTATRRSTRLRTQPKPSSPKAARKVLSPVVASETVPQSELSLEPIKADPLPFEGLPTVHSLSWQLQYPPGGSTHPCYPYPSLDPRLLFHQAFVPIIGGLPDFTLVQKLVLPMGWKHVSWSGLLPIAFDPYRQAFKLTPVGPMPLTCEESHQQGLHKYVPGGELHPEYGLVPEMLKLSDGSDTDVFNFDSVDWVLPWKGQIDFHAPSNATNEQLGSYEITSPVGSDTFAPVVTYSWSEARDCPDKVFDICDAWRWLSSKEANPEVDFIPTPDMNWRGTGAMRSQRRLKSPIPELMMLAMQSDPTTSESKHVVLLQNQDRGAKGKNQFCAFKSVATSVMVDMALLGDTEFTTMELLSYFPQHYYWGHAAERLTRAGVTGTLIRDFLIMTRGLQGDEIMMANSIAQAAKVAKKRDCVKVEEMDIDEAGKDTPSPTPAPVIDSTVVDLTSSYTAEGWIYDVWEKIDYPLLALTHGLQSLPTGVDAGPLTALILWCREKGRYKAMLSEVPALLKEANIEPLIEPGENGCPDKEVAGRHAGALKKDRLRVVRDAGVSKRALDGSVGGTQGKRRRAE
ncbi:hypothetical protein J4E85_009463 [Alternaria conjuncta]|uniref:uncharacterized protein n=1 Tax=Alternaria conjuncta TaxID=181017 RepID=UPI00221F14B2|nr:uncharacterized protein J4E85_009463 [Alternaria conjuncta]KAI4919206.1 hypothetical protein J4E85_009463 [Alternaria conjuncta]